MQKNNVKKTNKMFCKVFCFSDEKDLDKIASHLNHFPGDSRIITDNDSLNKHLKKCGKDSQILTEIFPSFDIDPESYTYAENAKKTLQEYEKHTCNLTYDGHKIFDGMENHLLTEVSFLEQAKIILEAKKNTIFILYRFSHTYFSILKISSDLGYNVNDTELELGYINGGKIDYLTPEKNNFLLEQKNKLNLIQSYMSTLSANTSKNKASLSLDVGKKIVSMSLKTMSSRLSNSSKIDQKQKILNQVEKKIFLNKKKSNVDTLFFVMDSVEFQLTPLYPLFKKFDESDKKFMVFTSDPVTSSFLQKKKIPFTELFEEIYLLANILKNSEESKKLENDLRECATENNLTYIYLKKLHPLILERIYQYLAMCFVVEHIISKMTLKSIVIDDGTIFGNAASSISKKYGIPDFYVTAAHWAYHPYAYRLKASRICIPGTSSLQNMIKSGLDEDRILVTGSPRYDYIKSLDSKKIKNFFYDDNHIDSKKKLISVAMSRWTKNDEVWMSELIKFCNKSNFEIIIKYHPRYKSNPEDTPFKIEYINQKCSNQKFILTPDLDIADVLVSSDVVISDFSSIVSETILMDKPVIMVNFLKLLTISIIIYQRSKREEVL